MAHNLERHNLIMCQYDQKSFIIYMNTESQTSMQQNELTAVAVSELQK